MRTLSIPAVLFALALGAHAQVRSFTRIDAASIPLDDGDSFGADVAWLGDLDGDGVGDLAVGAPGDDDRFDDTGAVWILFLETDGTVRDSQKISSLAGGFDGFLVDEDAFGSSVARIGDLDGDGVTELAVGEPGNGAEKGALWILFLNTDGTVRHEQKIGPVVGNFDGPLPAGSLLGASVDVLGDLDGDGMNEVLVGRPGGGFQGPLGVAFVLFLEPDGTVRSHKRIKLTALEDDDRFGAGVAGIGDVDGDGVPDAAVGASRWDDLERQSGSAWIVFLERDGSVRDYQPISNTLGGFCDCFEHSHRAGESLANLGDLDGDGVSELAMGSSYRTLFWYFFLDDDGTSKGQLLVDRETPALVDAFAYNSQFASGIDSGVDLDSDGTQELAVGAPNYGEGSDENFGAVFVLFPESSVGPRGAPIGTSYCDPGAPNATGQPGLLEVSGSTVVADDELTLKASRLPGDLAYAGLFLMGTGNNVFTPPGAAGPICVTPGMERIGSALTYWGGMCRRFGTDHPETLVILPGSTWNFQAWHREPDGTSNLTNAVSVTFQ